MFQVFASARFLPFKINLFYHNFPLFTIFLLYFLAYKILTAIDGFLRQ